MPEGFRPLTYLSVCSGIEAATVAWKPLGWEAIGFAEIDKFPSAVLTHHYPGVKNYGDFTKIELEDLPCRPDILVGGTPCQSFSVAGKRAGLDDPRGNLTLEFVRLAARLRTRWLVWENVPGILSIDGGQTFGSFLGALGEVGYGFAYRICDAQYAGVPQRRRRVFLVGHLGDWRRAAAVLFERQSLSGDSPPSREKRENPTYDLAPCIGASSRDFDRAGDTRGQDCCAPVLERRKMRLPEPEYRSSADLKRMPGPQLEPVPESGMPLAFGGNNTGGPIDVATACNAHGGPNGRLDFESETFVASGRGYWNEANGSQPIGTQARAIYESTLVTHSLRADGFDGFDASEDGTGRGTPLVPVAFRTNSAGQIDSQGDLSAALTSQTDPCTQFIVFSCKDSGLDSGEISPTLRSMNFSGSHANAGGQVAVAYGISNQPTPKFGEDVCPSLDAKASGGGRMEAVAFNLRGREGGSQPEMTYQASLRSASGGSSRSYVAVELDSQLNGEIEGIGPLNIGSSSGGGQPARVAQESSVIGGKGSAMQVRRLTPL